MSTDVFSSGAFDRWLTTQPELSPAEEEWQDAQDEKKQLLKQADDIIEAFPMAGLDSSDDVAAVIEALQADLLKLVEIRDAVAELEEEFPENYPDPDQEWDE